jgi:hypothetical protein
LTIFIDSPFTKLGHSSQVLLVKYSYRYNIFYFITQFQVTITNCRALKHCMNISYVVSHKWVRKLCFIISLLLCEYRLYFDVDMWSVVCLILEKVYNWLLVLLKWANIKWWPCCSIQ